MDWKEALRSSFTSWSKLADFLELKEEDRRWILQNPHFPLKLPRRLAEKIEKGNSKDPLLLQFLPHREEGEVKNGFSLDPVADIPAQLTSNLLHKYAGRALLVATGACAMHCRYCFRQNYPYDAQDKSFPLEITLLKNSPDIEELILSGGDPLSLSNAVWEDFFDKLREVPHLKRIRIHSRFPIGIPERIDAGFLTILQQAPWQIFFVIHVNHPKELDKDVFAALKKLQRLGIPILNQAVLLKGVNDEENILLDLYKTLADQGILAYYLHQLDKVVGAFRFEAAQERGKELIEYLKEHLPGYAVPKYVQTVQNSKAKKEILPLLISK